MHARNDTARSCGRPSLCSPAALLGLARASLERESGSALAILAVAPDGFSRLRDSIGYERAARLLDCIAERLLQCAPQLAIARVGEHEFVLLVPLRERVHDLDALWHELRALLALPYGVETGEVCLQFCAGVARIGLEELAAGDGLDAAGAALHHAQKTGPGQYSVFRAGILREARARVELEHELRLALARRELQVHFQPVMHTRSAKLRGAEALVRWKHASLGWVPPARFVPVAEECGLIHELGEFVLGQVLAWRARWRTRTDTLARAEISFNVSARQLDDDRFVEALERARAQGLLEGPPLWMELTETALVADGPAARARLLRIRGMGLRLALDDLGMGYSSLLQLRDLPFDALKIDRMLTAGVGTEPLETRLFGAICALARSIPLCVVAEGIETHAQLEVLRREGVACAQGYLWSPALPAADFQHWNEQRARSSA
ncbi:MAG: EAL domain-containing protein [Planctomycetes bacterium]|nr:EAL domain-containing protein [Planctomycetota bacterium]